MEPHALDNLDRRPQSPFVRFQIEAREPQEKQTGHDPAASLLAQPPVSLTLSEEAQARAAQLQEEETKIPSVEEARHEPDGDPRGDGQEQADLEQAEEREGVPKGAGKELSPEDAQLVQELAKRDQEVKTHEQQHLAAAGGFSRGGIHLETTTGPDGQQYAVGGSVNIDTSEVAGDPQATISKARIVRAAALAPADPSGADMAVAAKASAMEMRALSELQEQDEGTERPEEGDNQEEAESPSSASASRHRRELAKAYGKTGGL
jgi:hypothetical protein